ncbi:hypothetical protein QVA66_01615 [Staphylococcus chromogenes]|nr:hypothetical protein [Staphylococcus chromogenes]
MKWCGRVLLGFTALLSLYFLYAVSIPGGGGLDLFFFGIVPLSWLVIFYVILCVVGISQRKSVPALWLVPLPAVVVIGLAGTGAVERWHWTFIRDDLAAAGATCLQRVGLVRVERCTTVMGHPAFDFGGGFIDQVLVTTYEGDEVGLHKVRSLDDQWHVYVKEF